MSCSLGPPSLKDSLHSEQRDAGLGGTHGRLRLDGAVARRCDAQYPGERGAGEGEWPPQSLRATPHFAAQVSSPAAPGLVTWELRRHNGTVLPHGNATVSFEAPVPQPFAYAGACVKRNLSGSQLS